MKRVHGLLDAALAFFVAMGACWGAMASGFDRPISMGFGVAMAVGFALLVEREKRKARTELASEFQELLTLRFDMDDNGKKDKTEFETRAVNGARV
jgi:hypothetical protein